MGPLESRALRAEVAVRSIQQLHRPSVSATHMSNGAPLSVAPPEIAPVPLLTFFGSSLVIPAHPPAKENSDGYA